MRRRAIIIERNNFRTRTYDHMSECCENCGVPEARYAYRAFQIAKHIQMKRSGTRFKYQFNFYKSISTAGATFFVRDKPNPPRPLSPDAVAFFGDAHLYWLRATEKNVRFCSRTCASQHAEANSLYLMNPENLSSIAPGQEGFDEYARANGLQHSIALIEADEAVDRTSELRALLKTEFPQPDRVARLACEAAANGATELARSAVSKLLNEHPLSEIIGNVSNILARLSDQERIDELHEDIALARGGRQQLSPEFLSAWAFLILGHASDKALELSQSAIEMKASSVIVVENHLSILSMKKPEEALAFYEANKEHLKTDVGWFAAGRCLLLEDRLDEAYSCIVLAEKHHPDVLNKTYLAEILYRLGRYPEVSGMCEEARKQLETYQTRATVLGTAVSHYTYDQKQILRKGLLVIEGKSRIEDGQAEFGRRLLRDAIDIRTPFDPNEPFLRDVVRFSEGYLKRSELETDLAQMRISADAAEARASKAEYISNKLRMLLSTIESARPNWLGAFDDARGLIGKDGEEGLFEQSIAALVDLIRNSDLFSYQEHSMSTLRSFGALPKEALQSITNASFLLDEHRSDEVPLFAPVILEYAKALEVSLNRLLIEPFAIWIKESHKLVDHNVRVKLGREVREVHLMQYGKHRALSLGGLFLLISGGDNRWIEYLRDARVPHLQYLTKNLPRIVGRVKDKRNGLAHYSSATRSQALEVERLLNEGQVFERLNDIARSRSR